MMMKNKYIAWQPSGVFSSHHLLERLPQAGRKLYGLTDEDIEIVKGEI